MMASLLLSRVLGILRDMIMAWTFGQGPQTDAYVLAFQIPDLLFFLIAGGALSSAFIPVFSDYLHTGREEDAWKVFGTVTTVMSLLITAFIVVAFVFAEPLTGLVAPYKSGELTPLIVHISRILLPAQFAFFVGGLMFGTLYARHSFVAPGMGPNLYNLGIIFGALVLSHFVTPGIVGMGWGALAGALVGNLVVPFWVMRRLGSPFRPSLDLSHPGVKKVFRLMAPVVFGLSLPGVYGMIMRALGTAYPDGVNTALEYANKLQQAPLGVFGQSLAIAAFPALSQFYAQKRMDLYRDQLLKTMRTVVYLTLPVSALMFALSNEIVAAVFQYGKFTAANADLVAGGLRMFCLGIACWCLHPVLMRAFFAVHNTLTPVILGTLTTFVFLGTAMALQQTALGYLALPLAGSVASFVLVIALVAFTVRVVGDFGVRKFLVAAAKLAVAAGACGLAAKGLVLVLPHGEGLGRNAMALVKLAGLGLGGAWVYYFLTLKMGFAETGYVARALDRISRRKPFQPAEPKP